MSDGDAVCGVDDGATVCVLPQGHTGPHQSSGGRTFMWPGTLKMGDGDALQAGREMDCLIAEKVLGMRVERKYPSWYRGGDVEVICFYLPGFDLMEYSWDEHESAIMYANGVDDSLGVSRLLPQYSAEIEAAWQVVEQMLEQPDQEVYLWFVRAMNQAGWCAPTHVVCPRICRAALAALRADAERE